MERQVLFAIVVMMLSTHFSYSQEQQQDNKKSYNDSYLLFELGIVYPELEFIVSQQLSIDEGETQGRDTCESLAKQKATEYFGVTLESEATIRESYHKNNDVETSQTEVESSIISSAKAKVKLTSLKQTARHQKGKILVHCVYKAVKYQTAKDQNGIG